MVAVEAGSGSSYAAEQEETSEVVEEVHIACHLAQTDVFDLVDDTLGSLPRRARLVGRNY